MRAIIIILGLAIAVVGGAIFVSPINTTKGVEVHGVSPSGAIGLSTPYGISDTVQYNVTWTGGNNSTFIEAWQCSGGPSSCPGNQLLASLSGSSGGFTLALPPGTYFTLNSTFPLHTTVTTLTEGAQGIIGIPILLFGTLVLTYGWLAYAPGTPVPTGASRRLDYYLAGMTVLLVAAGILTGYLVNLGPLTSINTESSFGLGLGLASLDLGLIVHIFDVSYRDRALAVRRGEEP